VPYANTSQAFVALMQEKCHVTSTVTQVTFPNTETNTDRVNGFYCQNCSFN